MPKIIDYAIVLKRLTDEGLDCHYYNGGSFGFGAEAHVARMDRVGGYDH